MGVLRVWWGQVRADGRGGTSAPAVRRTVTVLMGCRPPRASEAAARHLSYVLAALRYGAHLLRCLPREVRRSSASKAPMQRSSDTAEDTAWGDRGRRGEGKGIEAGGAPMCVCV